MWLGTSPRHSQWFCKSFEGLFTSTVALFFHVFSYSVTTKLILRPWVPGGCPVSFVQEYGGAWLHWIAYTAVFDISIISHLRCMLSNPGAVPHTATPLPEVIAALEEEGEVESWLTERFCHKCRSFKPLRAYHEKSSGRCIINLDHYCTVGRILAFL